MPLGWTAGMAFCISNLKVALAPKAADTVFPETKIANNAINTQAIISWTFPQKFTNKKIAGNKTLPVHKNDLAVTSKLM